MKFAFFKVNWTKKEKKGVQSMIRVRLFLSNCRYISESFEKRLSTTRDIHSLSPNSKGSLIKEETFLSYPLKSTN